jgi:hypothetical protein
MPRRWGCGGQPIPGSKSSEEVEVEGVMGDHNKTLQLLETIAKGEQQVASE